MKYRASLSPARRFAAGPYADWIVESDDGLLCEGMCKSEARMVVEACNFHDALVEALEYIRDLGADGADKKYMRAQAKAERVLAFIYAKKESP